MEEYPTNFNLIKHVLDNVQTHQRVKKVIKEKNKLRTSRCVQCFDQIPDGKQGRKCKKCREGG